MIPTDVLILAAGKGERLRPITDRIPKPLVPFLGFPIIDYIALKLTDLKAKRVFLNSHHLARDIERYANRFWSDSSFDFFILPEESLLGSGGPLRRVFDKFGSENILIHNGDLIHDIHVSHEFQLSDHSRVASLLLTNIHVAQSTPVYAQSGRLSSFGNEKEPIADGAKTFSGIYQVNDSIVDYFPNVPSFSIIDVLKDVLRESQPIDVLIQPVDSFWFDLGTPTSWLNAQSFLISSRLRMERLGFFKLAKSRKSDFLFVESGQKKNVGDLHLIGPVLTVDSTLAGRGSIGPNVVISDCRAMSGSFLIKDSCIIGAQPNACLGSLEAGNQLLLLP